MKTCSIYGCEKRSYVKGWCVAHYTRYRNHGSPHGGITSRGAAANFMDFCLSADTDHCIKWPFATDKKGYGLVTYNGMQKIASRVVCILAHGHPPEESYDCAHSCGNGHMGCVNPRHLRWATRKENHADKKLHGTRLFGHTGPSAKLSEQQASDIKSMAYKVNAEELGKKYGISRAAVYLIWKGSRWAHLE